MITLHSSKPPIRQFMRGNKEIKCSLRVACAVICEDGRVKIIFPFMVGFEPVTIVIQPV